MHTYIDTVQRRTVRIKSVIVRQDFSPDTAPHHLHHHLRTELHHQHEDDPRGDGNIRRQAIQIPGHARTYLDFIRPEIKKRSFT